MKCVRLSTLGVGIGSIIIIGFTITIIYTIKVLCDFGNLTDEDKKGNADVWSSPITILYTILVICLIAISISGLLIAGIIKKRHVLMRPWICCAFAGIIFHGFRVIMGLFAGFISAEPFGTVFSSFVCGAFNLGIELFMLFTIHKLYKEIRDKTLPAPDTELEVTGIYTANDNPPSYSDLERNGQLNK